MKMRKFKHLLDTDSVGFEAIKTTFGYHTF